MNSSLTRTELLAFWKKIEEKASESGPGAVVAVADQRVGLGFFLGLALDEIDDVRVVGIEDGHLGRATSFAAALDDAGEGIESAHEAQGTAGRSAAGDALRELRTQRAEVGAGARAALEEHAPRSGQVHDRLHASRRRH